MRETEKKKTYPCEHCIEDIYMTVEERWWCNKHLMYACQVERSCDLCDKFNTTSEDDVISRKEMLDYQEYLHGKMSNEENYELWEFIKGLPSVTPVPKKGKWIKVTNGRGGHECSLCHAYAPSYQNSEECLSDFCPNCGAKMDK